ncbi:MAG: hypothetical protein MI863_00315 [Desulfobacterales bacterium]|nr:hypothetical protein [Desulfobacterales bacterium]
MKSNFHLQAQKKNKELYIDLHGIFDGASAFELIEVIEEGDRQGLAIFIDTSNLKQAYSFGRTILDNHLPKSALRAKLHFSGVWAEGILPDGCVLFNGKHKNGHRCKGNCKNCACGHGKSQKEHLLS